jgi:hypothetical protein
LSAVADSSVVVAIVNGAKYSRLPANGLAKRDDNKADDSGKVFCSIMGVFSTEAAVPIVRKASDEVKHTTIKVTTRLHVIMVVI